MNNRIQAHHLHQLPKPTIQSKKNVQETNSFKDLLQMQVKDSTKLTISNHAQKRLQDRGIQIDEQKWMQISSKVQEAKTKGVHDSIVVLNDATLVVSAKNNIVITAMGRDEAKSQIFTNINGTILMD